MKNIFIFILAFVMSMPKIYFVEIDKGLIFKTPEYKINPEELLPMRELYTDKKFKDILAANIEAEKKEHKKTKAIKKQNKKPTKDEYLLALICMAEAEGEPEYGQRLVIDTVLNRVEHDKFPNTISGVVYQKNQFTSMWNGRANRVTPTKKIYKLVEEELHNRTNYDCIFFTAGQYGEYGRKLFRVSNHYFSAYK